MLLKKAGITFKTVHPSYKETNRGKISAFRLTRKHALGKALSVAWRVTEGVVLGCDTVVVHEGRILGKPRTMKEAASMLSSLTGRWHVVMSSVALIRLSPGRRARRIVFTEKTRVRLRKMESGPLRSYLKRIGPLDKAGAYAAQAAGKGIVERVKGSFSNVVGLPIEKLQKHLRMLI